MGQLGVTSNGYLATTLQAVVHGTFGADPGVGLRIVQGCKQSQGVAIVDTTFNAHRALADGRQGDFWPQAFANPLGHFQAFEPGAG